MRASDYDRAIRNLDEFLAAFGRLLAVYRRVDDWPQHRWLPRPGTPEDEINSRYREVALLAGPAADAFDLSGMAIDHSPPGTLASRPVNPAMIWSTFFGESPMADPSLIATVGAQALGRLQDQRDEQADRERGFIGAIAWFFTLAPRVRAAAGLPARSASGRLVTWTTATIQGLIVTAVGGALVFPLVSWLGWGP